MKFAIIDDDLIFAKDLYKYILSICGDKDITPSVKTFNPDEAVKNLSSLINFDVIFLDIEMPEISGTDLAEKINLLRGTNSTPYIIFVTGKDNLVFEALKKLPYSFVRKSHLEDIDICIETLSKKISATPMYNIKIGRDIKSLEIKNIIYLEKKGNYTAFYTTEGIFRERAIIDDKQKDLKEHGFLRPHIGYLVNAAHITEFSGSFVGLSCGKEVTISRNYKKSLKEEFNEWMVKTQ